MPRLHGRAFAFLIPFLLVALPAQGGEGVRLDYGQGIVIEGSEDFVSRTNAALNRLKSLPTGAAILSQLGRKGHSTRIVATSDDNGYADPTDWDASETKGVGSSVVVQFNPDYDPENDSPTLVLGHELIHAVHMQNGEVDPTLRPRGDPESGVDEEELATAGISGHESKKLTDANLRREWNYHFPGEEPMALILSYRDETYEKTPAPAWKNRQTGVRGSSTGRGGGLNASGNAWGPAGGGSGARSGGQRKGLSAGGGSGARSGGQRKGLTRTLTELNQGVAGGR
jgi:hypothetical protein